MLNKYKRVITLILALLMVSSIFFGLFAAIASAAGVQLEVITPESSDTITISGTPDVAVFKQLAGKYTFSNIDITTIATPKFSVAYQTGAAANDVTFVLSADKKSITYGGLTIVKKDDTEWSDVIADNKEFFIKLGIKQGTGASDKEPIITYSKTVQYKDFSSGGNDPNGSDGDGKSRSFQSMYEITRNRDVNILLTISDPNGGVIDPDSVYLIPESGSFRSISTSEVNDDTNQATRMFKRVKTLSNGKQALEIDIIRLRYTGRGNSLKFVYGYTLDSGTPDASSVEYNGTVTISECVEYVKKTDKDDPETDPKDLDPLTPHIIIDKYSYGSGQVTAGQEFPLNITITNTSPGYDIENIVMTITPPVEGLALTSSSNTYYIPNLGKKKSIEKAMNIRALPNAKPQSHNITIDFTFQYVANEKRIAGTSKEVIAIPVTQVDRFAVNPIEPPAYLYVGDEYPISAVFVNKGRSEVFNVSAEIRGDIPNPGQKQFIGNIESGKENSADFFIQGEEAGPMKGEVIVTYEDANMNIKEIVMPFEVMVQAMDFGPPPDIDMNPMPEPDKPVDAKADSKKVSLGFAGLIIASLTAFINVKKVKAKRIGDDNEDI